jgi:hypothetical protein
VVSGEDHPGVFSQAGAIQRFQDDPDALIHHFNIALEPGEFLARCWDIRQVSGDFHAQFIIRFGALPVIRAVGFE